MGRIKEVKRKKRGKKSRYGNRYELELKLHCVKMFLEKILPVSLGSKEVGASKGTLSHVQKWRVATADILLISNRAFPSARQGSLKFPFDSTRYSVIKINLYKIWYQIRRETFKFTKGIFSIEKIPFLFLPQKKAPEFGPPEPYIAILTHVGGALELSLLFKLRLLCQLFFQGENALMAFSPFLGGALSPSTIGAQGH